MNSPSAFGPVSSRSLVRSGKPHPGYRTFIGHGFWPSRQVFENIGAPYGNRTRVSAVKGRQPVHQRMATNDQKRRKYSHMCRLNPGLSEAVSAPYIGEKLEKL
jgi:hypothetical protein